MNFLAHLYLSGDNPGTLTGNLMGDFIKGKVSDELPLDIAKGIFLHRRIDSFVQRHPSFRRSRNILNRDLGLYRGVVVDLFYDHFLVVDWGLFHDMKLDCYLTQTKKIIEVNFRWLPPRLQTLLPYIFGEMVPSYRSIEGIGLALRRISKRVSRANPLPGAEVELVRHYEALRKDFRVVLTEAREFVGTGDDFQISQDWRSTDEIS